MSTYYKGPSSSLFPCWQWPPGQTDSHPDSSFSGSSSIKCSPTIDTCVWARLRDAQLYVRVYATMAEPEAESDKSGSTAVEHDMEEHDETVSSTDSALDGAERDENTRQAVQKLLEGALVAAGLGELSLRDDRDKESDGTGGRSRRAAARDPPCELQKLEEEGGDEGTKEEGDTVVEWVDITHPFIEAASLLDPGELVQHWNFSLLDAMSAVELLDPKMDSSMHWTDFKTYPRTVSEASEQGLLQFDGHTNSQLIGIFDEVLACVVTWLSGYTLAQTVFSCLYLLETDRAVTPYLRTFSMAVVKMVDYMREYICRGGVYAEDDQLGMCFGFNMLTSVSDTTVSAALRVSEERASTSARQSLLTDRQRDGGEGTVSKETEELRAVSTRIRFVRNLFGLILLLRRRSVSVVQPILKHLNQCLSLLSDIIISCPLGGKLDPHNPLKLGFHPLINHNLLPPSYRQCSIMPREDALASLRTTLKEIDSVLGSGKLDSLKSLKEWSRDFCSQQVVPNVFARSVLVLTCMQSDRTKMFGSPSLEEMLKKDAHEFSNPPSLNPRSALFTSTQGKELTERFFGRAVHPMFELLRVYCHPRALQQEKTEHVLDFLADLQHETERIDQLLNEVAMKTDPMRQHLACYASWVLYHTLCLMIDYVVMGFEYNLYSPFEYHYVYWYLEYLYGWLHTSWKTADKLNPDQSVVSSGKANKKKGKRLRRETVDRKEREVAIVQVKRLVCVGMMRGFEAMILEGKVHTPPFEYGSQELCFQHRFAAFACIATPHLLTFGDYEHLAGVHNYRERDINLYEAASRHFTSARAVLESLPHPSDELQGLLKVAKMNIVIMNLSANGHKRESKVKPVLDFSLHNHFPVIRIQ